MILTSSAKEEAPPLSFSGFPTPMMTLVSLQPKNAKTPVQLFHVYKTSNYYIQNLQLIIHTYMCAFHIRTVTNIYLEH